MARGRERRHSRGRKNRKYHFEEEERLRAREEERLDKLEGKWSRGNRFDIGRRIRSTDDLLYEDLLEEDEEYGEDRFV